MSNVYIMVGPPCSGKSTIARKVASSDPSIIRVNRDELRMMLKGKYIVGGYTEKIVDQLIKVAIVNALLDNHDVVVDATHCKMKYINDVKAMIPTELDVQIKYVVCNTPYWLQRWRNFWRWIKTGIWIPKGVSKAMHRNFLLTRTNLKEAHEYQSNQTFKKVRSSSRGDV